MNGPPKISNIFRFNVWLRNRHRFGLVLLLTQLFPERDEASALVLEENDKMTDAFQGQMFEEMGV